MIPMRKRLTQQQRQSDILKHARELFHQRGFTETEMEDIRNACGISRGGLYHHFGNKVAILNALVTEEVEALADVLEASERSPIEVLLEAGSSHLGNEAGIITALKTTEEKLTYLSGLDLAITRNLSPILGIKLADSVRPDVNPAHVAELFLTVNAHINRRTCLGDWTEAQSAKFAATALEAIAPFLKDPSGLHKIIQTLNSVEPTQ